MEQSYLKAAIDGVNGSGKSGTSARLAVGIAKEYCNSAPVLAFDSEERWRFYKRTIFDVEKVPLIRVSGTSLIRLTEALTRAETEGACVFVGDQLTTPWKEGVKAFSYEDGYLPFERRQQLMNQWYPVIHKFRYGKFHAICAGRLGYEWENLEDDRGRLRLTQGDSKFNAGGGENFGYEADLELEMRRNKRRLLSLLRNKTEVEYLCEVVKDATGGILNGKQFVFSGQGLYRRGDYKSVLEAFRPYIDFMRGVEPPSPDDSSASDLLISGKTEWAKDQTERKGLLEELDANLQMCFPSGEGKSKMAKMFRDLTLEELNGFISWSRMEEECRTSDIERNVLIVKTLRKLVEGGDLPTDQTSLRALVRMAMNAADELLHPGKKVTLLEVLAEHSINKRGPQPIVKAMDTDRFDEMEA